MMGLIGEQEIIIKEKMDAFMRATEKQSRALVAYLVARKERREIELDLRNTLAEMGYDLENDFHFTGG
jgi:hypothetical protein